MGFMDKIADNIYLTTLVIAVSMLITEYFFYKRQHHYNLSKEERMKSHYLNRKYRLNKKKNVDVEKINRYICLSNVAGIVVGGLLMAFVDMAAGVISYMVISFGLSFFVMDRIGRSYQYTK